MSGRLPFDPTRARGRSEPSKPKDDAPLSVSQLASSIDAALRRGLPQRVRVWGEVSGLRERTHLYFDLKDGSAVVNSVMFASAWRKSKVPVENGSEVVASGRVEFYAPGGKVSLIVDRLEPVGRGALEAQLRALVEELRGLGWLDDERKRGLPVFPRRIAVITSRSGAALQDVIDTARRRCPAVELLTIDARVQGDGAAREVAQALRWVSDGAEKLGVDAVLVTRGGGSMEDLWAFNERLVARAIVECSIPVVAAIGHETDTTVAELVADLRAATPTQAAMRLTPDREALERELSSLWRRATGRVRDAVVGGGRDRLDAMARRHASALRVASARLVRRVDGLAVRLERARPASVQARRSARVDELASRLRRVGRRAVHDRRLALPGLESTLAASLARLISAEDERLAGLERELRAVGPESVLARGFSMTTTVDGRAVRTTGDVRPGTAVRTRVADGSFESVVGGVPTSDPGRARGESPPAPRRRSRRGGASRVADPSQMDLFSSGEGG